ncbi:MAG: CAP domain-containing protein [Akkermansiaceae bacterium]|nr:CAP domain-containing protein [Akkermansiaceae bacterium]
MRSKFPRHFPQALAVATVAAWHAAFATTFVPSAEPTAHEQLMLELVNRARANPGAEATRLGIGLNQDLPAGTITNTPKQPLAWHAALIQAARGHSQWMLNADKFDHTGSGGSTWTQRVQAAGYPLGGGYAVGENIGWGPSPGAVDLVVQAVERHDDLFRSAKHRLNICQGSFDEAGIGLLAGVFTIDGGDWNASMVTQDFAYSGLTSGPLVTGVAYHDFNGNGFYDVGEGIQGVIVNVSGSAFHTVTAAAGGYAVPVPAGAATRTVTFSHGGLAVDKSVTMTGSANQKVDFTPVYQPLVLAGSATPVAGLSNRYTLTPDPFATARQVLEERSAPVPEDAATNLDRVTAGTSAGYSALSAMHRRSPPVAYHLAHLDWEHQFLTYKAELEVGANAELTLWSRLGIASPAQTAVVQVSADGGIIWTTVFSQAGTYEEGSTNYGEADFVRRVVSLASFAGKRVRLRLGYLVSEEDCIYGADESPYWGLGWYVDDLTFTNIREVTPLAVHNLASGADFYFRPPSQGACQLVARSVHHDRLWPCGPALAVTAGPETPTLATWAAKQEDANGLPPGTLLGNLGGDYQGNGVPLVLARALGLNPVTATTAALPKITPHSSFLDFDYWRDLAATETTLTPEIAVDGRQFFALGSIGVPVSYTDSKVSTVGNLEYRRLRIAKSAAPKVFVRLKATAN